MAGKLWNLTDVVRRWQVFRVEAVAADWMHDSRGSKKRKYTVELGREFHADLLRKWAIDHELLLEGGALSDPCYTAIKRSAEGTICFEVVGGFCVERKVFCSTTCRKN